VVRRLLRTFQIARGGLVDNVSPAQRSELMAKVGQRDTGPELAVRKQLFAAGFRFRLHCRDLPGRPDIVLRRHNLAIFVHGCFWHRHPGCKRASSPKSRQHFWMKKFAENVDRDKRVKARLRRVGWRVWTIWECEAKKSVRLTRRVRRI